MTFYAAVHLVEAYFFTQGIDHGAHQHRDTAIKRDKNIGGAWRAYEALKNASETARYEAFFFTTAHYSRIRKNLEDVRSVVTKFV